MIIPKKGGGDSDGRNWPWFHYTEMAIAAFSHMKFLKDELECYDGISGAFSRQNRIIFRLSNFIGNYYCLD